MENKDKNPPFIPPLYPFSSPPLYPLAPPVPSLPPLSLPIGPLPEKIGPYKIEALLNKGGMSYLYLGTHPETHLPLTIKVLSQKYITHPEVVQRFLNEAEIISISNHPNIIKMHGHGEWEGGLYIAMEYIEGISLRHYIQNHPLSLKRALKIILDIAYALCHLHTHGVIHRDLKPENILLTESGEIKVIDFGIAQLLTETPSLHPSPSQRLVGTPIYISPEQKENPETVSFPSDIYSLGIIAYELILGKLSMGHIHLSLMPKGMQPILHKCLQPLPNNRYQDVVDLITEISSYLNSPLLQKDKIAGDRLCELSEEMQKIHHLLFFKKIPEWPEIEIGVALHRGIYISGMYVDFFKVEPHKYVVILGESPGTGGDSFIHCALLRGMVSALYASQTQPETWVPILNDLLIKEKMSPILNFAQLIIQPQEHTTSYISCGGNLWILSAQENTVCTLLSESIPLGSQKEKMFPFSIFSWNFEETLVLTTLPLKKSEHQESLKNYLKELTFLPPQKLAEAVLRKARFFLSSEEASRTQICLCLKREP